MPGGISSGAEQSLAYYIACPVDIRPVVKGNSYCAESETTDGADFINIRNAAHGILHWERNELFHLNRSEGRRIGQDLYLHVGKIGHCVQRNCGGCEATQAKRNNGQQHDDETIV